jgi:microcystin-dependent protein
MPIGVSGSYTLASTGGSASTTLSIPQLPAHNHAASVSDPTHAHGTGVTINTGNIPDGLRNPGNYSGVGSGTYGAYTGISVSTSNTGSGTAINTISPYLTVNFIIKT